MKHFIIVFIISLTLLSCGCYPKQSYSCYAVDEDALILSSLIEHYGVRLDACYNPSKEDCEKGNWLLDVASEMDWRDLITYIINMPDFEDCEWAEIHDITNGKAVMVD